MTLVTTRSHIVLLATDHSVEDQLVISCLVLVLDDHQVPASGVQQVGDVVVRAAEQHLDILV